MSPFCHRDTVVHLRSLPGIVAANRTPAPPTGHAVVFGGEAEAGALEDTWTWDGATWTPGVPGPIISVGDVAVAEGDFNAGSASFTVSLSEPSASIVTVSYATSDAEADSNDFVAKAGALSFAPGTTSLIVKVPVRADLGVEGDETFWLILAGADGAAMGDASGMATIYDDDPQSSRRLRIGDVSVHEGDSGSRVAVFNVNLSRASAHTVTVTFATANGTATKPGDYTGRSGTLSFAPGTTSVGVKATINPDTIAEGNETFSVRLSSSSGPNIADDTGVGTIIDND